MLPLTGIARKLVIAGFFTEQRITEIIRLSIEKQMTFITYVIKQKLMPFDLLAKTIAEEFNLPLIDPSSLNLEKIPLHLISEQLIRQHCVLPLFKQDQTLQLAILDPSNQLALDEIKFHTGLNLNYSIIAADKLGELLEKFFNARELATIDQLEKVTVLSDSTISIEEIEDVPLVRQVNKILAEAIKKMASDIHFEPYEKFFRVRFRVDGVLYEIKKIPINLAAKITARLKIMAHLNIAERRIPQDGRLKITISQGHATDFRVSTCPTVFGEKIVLRLLNSKGTVFNVDELGFEAQQKTLFYKTLNKPQGLILVTGPTGSGKTITLYSALNILNTLQVNIVTVEDPVEIHLPGVNQVAINPKAGLNFATALRAFLRQDPDVLMVGEIRDLETAEICIQAAQTGHLVLSTLHTNSAAETLTRLHNMGIANYNLATSASLIIAQRLARKLCTHCKQPQKITPGMLPDIYLETQIYMSKGCEYCTEGYCGRVAIFELLEVTEKMTELIMQQGTALNIAQQAQEQGMQTLRQSAINKVKEGITSLVEINRVTLQ